MSEFLFQCFGQCNKSIERTPLYILKAKTQLHQSGFYTSTSAVNKTQHRNVKSSEFTHAACGKLPILQAVAMACYRILHREHHRSTVILRRSVAPVHTNIRHPDTQYTIEPFLFHPPTSVS